MAELEDRHKNEQDFWNRNAKKKYSNLTDYKLANNLDYIQLFSKIKKFSMIPSFLGNVSGKQVLELGAGTGWLSLYLGRSRANVYCTDISEENIKIANNYVHANKLEEYVKTKVMSAERIDFPDESFDIVLMNASLHHCDVSLVVDEIIRVLRKGGKAVFVEDNGYHPLLNFYRIFSKHRHTQYEAALSRSTVKKIRASFKESTVDYYYLSNVFENENLKFLNTIDDVLFRLVAPMKYLAKIIVIYCSK